jgi:cell division protein FtsI (penicillin-binding protein 3)
MAALEDGVVDTSDVFDTGNGSWRNGGRTISDTHGYGELTVKQILEKSSNIGVAKIITKYYGDNPKAYVDRVYSFGINQPLGLEIKGEGKPYFKYPGDSDWWGTTLAGMSYGYESKMTPLHILTFYNAVANNGKMVKPYIVKEIRDKGALEKRFKTEVINSQIASKETIGKAQKMLEGVCENGTGKAINSEFFKIAGKTGTARIASSSQGYNAGSYLASFAGYFPADNPKYSLIVTFKDPRTSIYGASNAGPVFKEIAEKVYALNMPVEEYDEDDNENTKSLPDVKKGYSKDIIRVAKELNIREVKGRPDSQLAKIEVKDDVIELQDEDLPEGKVPDVCGMGASNAIYLLEKAGLQVIIKGVGKVKQQSLSPGATIKPGQTVYLTLS